MPKPAFRGFSDRSDTIDLGAILPDAALRTSLLDLDFLEAHVGGRAKRGPEKAQKADIELPEAHRGAQRDFQIDRFDRDHDHEDRDEATDDTSDLLPEPYVAIDGDSIQIVTTSESGNARPSHAGGGGGGKGKWKDNTDTTPDEPDTTSGPTDGGSTDTDTGTTDGGTTDTGTTDTGTTSGSTDTGSTDTTDTDTTDTGTTTPAPAPQPDTYVAADFVSGMDNPDGFNIAINFVGAWTDVMKDQIKIAAEQISDVILGDLPAVETANGWIDDILITANLTSIDGAGGNVGRGGYTALRADSGLSSQGYLRIDEADVNKMLNYDVLDDLAVHEMLHSLGFGTAWSRMGLTETIDGSLRFTGQNAIDVYNDQFADIAMEDILSDVGVPVEMEGGSGTAGMHWDEEIFGKEIMSSQLNVNNTFSDLTVAALEDMGYDTYYNEMIVV